MLEFEGIINGFRKEMQTIVSNIENKFDQTIKAYENSAIALEQRLQDQGLSIFRLVAFELLKKSNKESPSETSEKDSDLHGERQ